MKEINLLILKHLSRALLGLSLGMEALMYTVSALSHKQAQPALCSPTALWKPAGIIRNYYEHLYTNKSDNIEKKIL